MIQITKEELGEIIDLTEQMCNLDGWVKEALPLAQRRMDIITLASARPHTPTSNPCEEQGCTDIENCDEICEHSRIYSPAWVKEHDVAIRNQLFSELEKLKASTDMGDIIPWCDVEKLRSTQQEQP